MEPIDEFIRAYQAVDWKRLNWRDDLTPQQRDALVAISQSIMLDSDIYRCDEYVATHPDEEEKEEEPDEFDELPW